MAVGDDANAAGYPLVPNTGEEGRVRYGAREINRTRDYIAQEKMRFSSGPTDPLDTDGQDGYIYFKTL